MTPKELVEQLHGNEYGEELTSEQEVAAREAGIVVVFGYSDDNVEFIGEIDDEIGCGEEETLVVDSLGVRSSWESLNDPSEDEARDYFDRERLPSSTITAKWNVEGYSWVYETDIPHETFDIMEDGEKYCRGIVFWLTDIGCSQ